MEKVSVIVPVFNTSEYISKCLDSILNQTYKNIEIVLVNDGSSDNSGEICASYADRHPKIKYINKENTGQADSRYLGFKRSTGKYIYCVDSDDTIEPTAVETLVDGLESNQSDMFFCRFRLVDKNNVELKETNKYYVELLEGKETIITDALSAINIKASLCIKICKRELWERCYSEEVRKVHFNEDYLLTVLFACESDRVGFSNTLIYNALQRTGSISRKVRPDMLLSHDHYFPIIRKSISNNLLGNYYMGYAKNLYYSMIIVASRLSKYSDYKQIYEMLTSSSIYNQKDYRNTVKNFSLSYKILDKISRRPRIFYEIIRASSHFINH